MGADPSSRASRPAAFARGLWLAAVASRIAERRDARSTPASLEGGRHGKRGGCSAATRGSPHGRGSTARNGCAHGSCQLQESESDAGFEEATSGNPTKQWGARGRGRGSSPKQPRMPKGMGGRARANGHRESTQGARTMALMASPKVRQQRILSDERRFGSQAGLSAFTSGRSAAAKAGGDTRGQKRQRLGRQASGGKTTPTRQRMSARRSGLGFVKGQGPR